MFQGSMETVPNSLADFQPVAAKSGFSQPFVLAADQDQEASVPESRIFAGCPFSLWRR